MNNREAQRLQQVETIKSIARRLLSESGPAGLVLREIAREMNQTSSALFRYFANRDELVTALIVDAYNDLGEIVEKAAVASRRRSQEEQFVATAHAIRTWAIRNPHIYALIYGTPIPGYEAPSETIAAASRVVIVLARIISDLPPARLAEGKSAFAHEDFAVGVENFLPERPPSLQGRALVVWSSLFGLVSFELFGHFVGSVQRPKMFFEASVRELWSWIATSE